MNRKMKTALLHSISALQAWLNNELMLIALIIGYLARTGKLEALRARFRSKPV
jgi:hypothetical protein